mmetsp:Transcript_11024/g.19537  ORF Transcript_11024/g.19537 Transcript_11024/m.19537 type:complete len:200 (-) Transcript_11024:57-656(-)
MWMFVFRSPEPNRDEDLFKLINLRHWKSEDRLLFDDAAVAKILRRNPGATRVKYNLTTGGRGTVNVYPIHRLVGLGASLKTVKLCGRAFKEALAERTETGGMVLHAACAHAADVSVVQWVYRQDPDAVKATNKHRFTPLHFACAYGAPAEVVQLLVKWYPEALNTKNILGETPHTTAVNHSAPAEVFMVLSTPETLLHR